MTEYSIRKTKPEDLEEIASMEQSIFSEAWTLDGFRDALSREDNIFLSIESGEEIAGYALCYGMMDEGEIPTIAVGEKYRKRGLGEALLIELIKEAQKQGIKKIFLEVRRSNQGAQHLYHKCGFEKVGERKNFYRFPQEDAILMAYEMR